MRILVTGGAGFIGSHLIDYMIENTTWDIVCIDKLTYASKGWNRLEKLGLTSGFYRDRLKLLTWDLSNVLSTGLIGELGDINIIIHMAAETHVDKSIKEPEDTIKNNVLSTINLLEYARTLKNLKIFQYFSTDEVFGPAPIGISYKENDRHNPTNPYSASKSASENICLSYSNTYGIPLIITNLMNAYGIMQHVEKFIPLIMSKILKGEKIQIHTSSNGIPGSRFYIHTKNIVKAIMFILENGVCGEKYNIPGQAEVDNLSLAKKIANILGKNMDYELISTCVTRPGHDNRYSLDGTKLFNMGFTFDNDFDSLLEEVVSWTLNNPEWIQE